MKGCLDRGRDEVGDVRPRFGAEMNDYDGEMRRLS